MPSAKKEQYVSKKKSYTLLLALLILVVVVLLNESPYLSGKFVTRSLTPETWIISCSRQQPYPFPQTNPSIQGKDLATEAGKSCPSACNSLAHPEKSFSTGTLLVKLDLQCTPKEVQSLVAGCLAQCQMLTGQPKRAK